MATTDESHHQNLVREWTDQFVKVETGRPELKRFEGMVGRVITVNWNGKAVVDFADGGWYDITASEEFLIKVPAADAAGKYDGKTNSAQPIPDKQS